METRHLYFNPSRHKSPQGQTNITNLKAILQYKILTKLLPLAHLQHMEKII